MAPLNDSTTETQKKNGTNSDKIIGIDLGTSNSVVSVAELGAPTVIEDADGHRTLPSVVAYDRNTKELMVGRKARRQRIMNPANTFASVKRFIGRRLADVSPEMRDVPYELYEEAGSIRFKCPVMDASFTPEEISARILRTLADTAASYLRQPVEKAVITIPAYFNTTQREATKTAGRIAGLDVVRIINEPTAAAFAYGLDKTGSDRTIFVFDLGGGTFDVSVLETIMGVFEVRASCGDSSLGGDLFDQLILKWLYTTYEDDRGRKACSRPEISQRFREVAEKTKISLSFSEETSRTLPFIDPDAVKDEERHWEFTLTRSTFERLSQPLVSRCKKIMQQVFTDAKIANPADITETVLVGGSTRIPFIQELVETTMQKEANKSVNPDEVVALGAALQGAVLAGEVNHIVLVDVTPLSLGVQVELGLTSVITKRNTIVPCARQRTYSTGQNNQQQVSIRVVQGERKLAKDNTLLGQFQLQGIPPAPAGVPQIVVEFQVDLNGIVAIDAKEKKSGVSQSCTITGASQLSAAEVERLVQEAARNRQQDKLDASRLRLNEQVKLLLEFLKTNTKVRDDDRLGHQRSALQDAYETTNRDSRGYDELCTLLREMAQDQRVQRFMAETTRVGKWDLNPQSYTDDNS